METKAREGVGRRRFTADEYHRMGEVGILREDERVELIEGEIVEMNPFGGRHVRCVKESNWLLGQQIRDGRLRVSIRNPIRLNGGLEDVLLVIEVSDATLGYDRNFKLPLYARTGLRESWIVDLQGEAVERHNYHSDDGYRRTERAGRGRTLASEVLPNLTIEANAVLG